MKYLVLIILIFFSQNYIMADEIDSNGIICDQNKEKSKRAPVKSFIYYFDDKNPGFVARIDDGNCKLLFVDFMLKRI